MLPICLPSQYMYGSLLRTQNLVSEDTTYDEYMDEYCKAFDTPYICVDIYPCTMNSDMSERMIYQSYLTNISKVAYYCRKYDRELWIMLQSLAWRPGHLPPSAEELRWQFFTVMAFGAVSIFHYCLSTPPGHTPGLISHELTRGPLFYTAKLFHRYLKSIEDIYLSYKPLGAFSRNADEYHNYVHFEDQYTDFSPIKELICEEPLLVGCFEKRDGDGYAFVPVNMTYAHEKRTAKIKMKLDAKRVTVYLEGHVYNIAPVDGYYEFILPPGEGVFVTFE